MFRALCAHHQEVKIVLYSVWYHHTCRWPSGAQVESGLRHEVEESRALLGYNAANRGKFLPSFWVNLSVPFSRCVIAQKSAVLNSLLDLPRAT